MERIPYEGIMASNEGMPNRTPVWCEVSTQLSPPIYPAVSLGEVSEQSLSKPSSRKGFSISKCLFQWPVFSCKAFLRNGMTRRGQAVAECESDAQEANRPRYTKDLTVELSLMWRTSFCLHGENMFILET